MQVFRPIFNTSKKLKCDECKNNTQDTQGYTKGKTSIAPESSFRFVLVVSDSVFFHLLFISMIRGWRNDCEVLKAVIQRSLPTPTPPKE